MPKQLRPAAEGVVAADSVVPGLYAAAAEDFADEAMEDVVDDLEYDVFNLVACDDHALNLGAGGVDSAVLDGATRATQLIVNK
jgi:hypothetical protein